MVQDLAPVLYALPHPAIGGRLPLELHETRDFAHICLFRYAAGGNTGSSRPTKRGRQSTQGVEPWLPASL